MAPSRFWITPVLLFTGLFAIYMLTFRGLPAYADEQSLVAATESLAKRGDLQTDQLAWTVWAHGWLSQDSPGVGGHIYSKKGIGLPFLLWPFWMLSYVVPQVGHVHALFLFNPVVCALAPVVVLAIARRWGYSEFAALLFGALAGLGTLLWPYSKTLFQEPASGLALIAAVYFVSGELRPRNGIAAGLMLAIAVLIRLTNAVAIMPVLLYAGYRLWRSGRLRDWPVSLSWLGGLVVLPALALGLDGYYNWLRFGNFLNPGYVAGKETFAAPLRGLSGLLFSLDEGLFAFCPLLVFAVLGLPLIWQRFRLEAILLLTTIGVYIAMFSSWYDWRGGVAWGPRFMVTIVLLTFLLALPLMHEWIFVRSGWRRWVVILVAAASVLFQAVAALVSQAGIESKWPILSALARLNLADPKSLDLAWYQPVVPPKWGIVAAFAAIVLFTCACALLYQRSPRVSAVLKWAAPGSFCLALLVSTLGLRGIYSDRRLPAGDDFRALAARLVEVAGRDDAVLFDNHVYTEFFMNYDNSAARRYGFLFGDTLQPEARAFLEGLILLEHRNIWLVTDHPTYAPIVKPLETWLEQHAFRVNEQSFSEYARLVRFYEPAPGVLQHHPTKAVFGGCTRLVGFDLPERDSWSAGEIVALRLHMESGCQSASPLSLSIQLLRPDGTLAWQRDLALPWHGVGQQTTYQYGIPLAEETPPGLYQLLAIVYDPASGRRAEVRSPGSANEAHELVMATLPVLGKQ